MRLSSRFGLHLNALSCVDIDQPESAGAAVIVLIAA